MTSEQLAALASSGDIRARVLAKLWNAMCDAETPSYALASLARVIDTLLAAIEAGAAEAALAEEGSPRSFLLRLAEESGVRAGPQLVPDAEPVTPGTLRRKKCSECDAPISRRAKTCSAKCRKARWKRLRKAG